MFRLLLKVFVLTLLIASVFLTVNYFLIDSQATNKLVNTFIPSSKNISNIEQKTEASTLSPSAPTFSEFTESSIDKNGFYIRIDKVGLFKKVVKDVDPRYKEVYVKSWETGVSHGKFTAYPDQIGNDRPEVITDGGGGNR